MKETTIYDSDGNTISSLVQWDVNVPIYFNESDLSDCVEVHFFHSNEDSAYVVEPSYDNDLLCAYVPNILLQENYTIYGYTIDSSGDTQLSMYHFKIPVRKKPKPDSYVYSDEDSFVDIVTALAECKALAESADTSATNAAASEANAATSESNAATSEANAEEYMNYSKSYAIGTDDEIRDGDSTDNASYYYDLCKSLAEAFEGDFIYMGNILFSELSSVDKVFGYIYTVTDEFVSDDTFVDGSGLYYHAGTNVLCTSDGYWDCMSGGGALSYRGSITYDELSSTDKVFGYIYTVTDEFVSDDTFVDGSGLYYHAGTNVLCTNDGYWDCMSGGIEDVEEDDVDTIFSNYTSVNDAEENASDTGLESDTITDDMYS